MLYSASDSKTLSLSGGGGDLEIISPSDGENVDNTVTVTWAGGNGTYTVYRDGVPYGPCMNINVTFCNGVPVGPGNNANVTIRVEDSDGESDEVEVD